MPTAASVWVWIFSAAIGGGRNERDAAKLADEGAFEYKLRQPRGHFEE